MIMENQTSTNTFQMLPFFIQSNFIFFYVAMFFIVYLLGVFINSVIIILIYISNPLHTPMYLFLCNLSIVDICYTTVTVPKLLYMGISRNNTISYSECFSQMYCYFLVASTEDLLTIIMASDRYVAICNPLFYHSILNKKHCSFLIAGCWIVGCLNANLFTISATKMTFCHSKTIHQFFCDGKTLINIACGGLKQFYIVIYIDVFLFGLMPIICCLISYIKIIKVILQIKSKKGRRKAFSTCSSHLTVIIMYYITGTTAYMVPKHAVVLQQVCSVLYTVVTPMINPLIYSLRNNDVKKALKKIIRKLKAN